MPRPKSLQPAYQFHVSGQAFVNLGGKRFYLGKHGEPASYAKYHALLAEYVSSGLKAPGNQDQVTERLGEDDILLKHVTADFRARVLPRYGT
jgi:hypothetical protein